VPYCVLVAWLDRCETQDPVARAGSGMAVCLVISVWVCIELGHSGSQAVSLISFPRVGPTKSPVPIDRMKVMSPRFLSRTHVESATPKVLASDYPAGYGKLPKPWRSTAMGSPHEATSAPRSRGPGGRLRRGGRPMARF
jgi:hypothetical protein